MRTSLGASRDGMARRAVVPGLVGILLLAGCEDERGRQERAVIAWAEKNGVQIDSWRAGQIPDEHFDEQAWVNEGRTIPDVERILRQLLEKRDKRIEPILVVQALGHVGTADSTPLLVKQLDDDWSVMRSQAIVSLGQIGGPGAVRALAEQVIYGRTSNNRRSAARALVRIGDAAGIEVLEEAIKELREQQELLEKDAAELRQKRGQGDRADPGSASRPEAAATLPSSRP